MAKDRRHLAWPRGARAASVAALVSAMLLAWPVALADRVDDLAKQLRADPDYKVRLSAALNLGKLGDRRAVPALSDALADGDKTVRGVAAAALGKLVDGTVEAAVRERAISELERLGRGDPDAFVRTQAKKSHEGLKHLAAAAGGLVARLAVEVGPMSSSAKTAADVVPLMRATVRDVVRKQDPGLGVVADGGAAPAGVAAFYVDGTLKSVSVKTSGAAAEVECGIALVVATLPERSMFGFANGAATVQSGAGDRAVDEATRDCVAAVVEDVVRKQVIPAIKQRAATVQAGKGGKP